MQFGQGPAESVLLSRHSKSSEVVLSFCKWQKKLLIHVEKSFKRVMLIYFCFFCKTLCMDYRIKVIVWGARSKRHFREAMWGDQNTDEDFCNRTLPFSLGSLPAPPSWLPLGSHRQPSTGEPRLLPGVTRCLWGIKVEKVNSWWLNSSIPRRDIPARNVWILKQNHAPSLKPSSLLR